MEITKILLSLVAVLILTLPFIFQGRKKKK